MVAPLVVTPQKKAESKLEQQCSYCTLKRVAVAAEHRIQIYVHLPDDTDSGASACRACCADTGERCRGSGQNEQ